MSIQIVLFTSIIVAIIGVVILILRHRHSLEKYSDAPNYAMLSDVGSFPFQRDMDEIPDISPSDDKDDDGISHSMKYTDQRYRHNEARRGGTVPLMT